MLTCVFLLLLDGKRFSFAVRRRGWQYLPLPRSFQAVFDLVRKGTVAAGAGMGATAAVVWGCTNAETSLLPRRGVTLVVW